VEKKSKASSGKCSKREARQNRGGKGSGSWKLLELPQQKISSICCGEGKEEVENESQDTLDENTGGVA